MVVLYGITREPANGLAPAGDMEPPGGFKRIEMVDLCGLGSLLHSYWKCMIYPTKMSDFRRVDQATGTKLSRERVVPRYYYPPMNKKIPKPWKQTSHHFETSSDFSTDHPTPNTFPKSVAPPTLPRSTNELRAVTDVTRTQQTRRHFAQPPHGGGLRTGGTTGV